LTGEHTRISREDEIRGFLANESRAIIMTNLHTQHARAPRTLRTALHKHGNNNKKGNLILCGRTQSTQDNTFLLQNFSAVFGES
jgi:virulence-associated protein VapD